MLYPDFIYVDTAIGDFKKRNNVIPANTLADCTGKSECYRSIYRFDKSYFDYCQENKSVSGYDGKCYADYLPMDIDDKNLNMAYRKTEIAINVLKMDYEFDVQHLFFSGSKGFHILIPTVAFGSIKPSKKLPAIFIEIAKSLLEDELKDTSDDKGHEGIDLKIYHQNALLRLTNTINTKSGLYKIPITIADFNQGIDYIKELAKAPQKSTAPRLNDCFVNQQFKEIFDKFNKNGAVIPVSNNGTTKSDLLKKLSNGVDEGLRDATAAQIAGLLHSKRMSRELTLQILDGWNLRNKPPLEQNELAKVVNSIFRYEIKDEETDIEKSILPIWAIYDEYKEFSQSGKKVNIGIPDIDRKIRGIRPGQVLTIMAYTGTFKSTILQNILRHYQAYAAEPVIMFELEMSRLDLFERSIQLEAQISGELVEKYFIENEDAAMRFVEMLKEKQGNFYVVDKAGIGYNDIGKYLTVAESKVYKRKTGLVGIDFIQLMKGDGYNEIQRMNSVAERSKQFAKQFYVPVVQLSQISGVESNEVPLHLMDVRNSKTISQMSDYVIGLWIEGDYLVASLLKNRKGGLCTVRMNINPESLRYKIVDLELEEYKADNNISNNEVINFEKLESVPF